MRKKVLWRSVVATLALLGMLVPARAEPVAPLRLETLVPASSLAFVAFEEVGSWGDRWKRTALGRLIADPEMRAFLDPVVEDVTAAVRKAAEGDREGKGPVPPILARLFEALRGLRGQAAACVMDAPKGRPPAIAAALDFGDHVADFTAFLERMGGPDGKVEWTKTEDAGRAWWAVGGEMPTTVTVVGTSVLASTDRAWLDGVVQRSGAPVADPLAGAASFRDVREAVGGNEVAAFVWANVPAVLDRVGLPERARTQAAVLGADTVRAAGYGLAFRGEGFADTLVLSAPGADHGILPLLRMRPATHRTLAWAPATTFLWREDTGDLAGLLGGLREVLAKAEPRAAREMDEALQDARRELGVDVESDLLAGLAGEQALYLGVPETGGLYPEAAAFLSVKDPAAYEGLFERAVNGLSSVLARERVRAVQRTVPWHGHRLHVLDLEASRGDDPVPFTPTWTILREGEAGWLVVTLVPHAMKELILRREAGTPGLAGEEDVKALLASAPPGHGGFLYLDTQAALSLLYDTGVPLLQAAVKPNVLGAPIRLDWAQLPAARTVRPYLRSAALFMTSDEKGLTVSVSSPTGILAPLAIVAAVAIPSLAARANSARSAHAQAEMQNIQMAIHMHYLDRRKLPTSLADLTAPPADGGEPFLESLPKDPWGGEYRYVVTDVAKRDFELRSAGPDGVFDTEDDVVHRSGS